MLGVQTRMSLLLRRALQGPTPAEARHSYLLGPSSPVSQGPGTAGAKDHPSDVVRAGDERQVPEHEPSHRELEKEWVGVLLLRRRYRGGVPCCSLPAGDQGGVHEYHSG